MTLLFNRNICIIIRIHYYSNTLLRIGAIGTTRQHFSIIVPASVIVLSFVEHSSLVFIKTTIGCL